LLIFLFSDCSKEEKLFLDCPYKLYKNLHTIPLRKHGVYGIPGFRPTLFYRDTGAQLLEVRQAGLLRHLLPTGVASKCDFKFSS
jgi:hypothetical protein